MRFTHRSKLAALLMMTSSAIHAASRAHIVENAPALLVEAGIGRKHVCLKFFTPDVVPAGQAFPGGEHLHAQYRGSRVQIDEIHLLVKKRGQPLLKIQKSCK